MNELMVWL